MTISNHLKPNQEFSLLIIPLLIIEFIRGAYIISYLPSLSVQSLGISFTIIGVAISVHFIGDASTNLIIGYVMERLGSHLVMQLSFFLSTIGLVTFSFWPSAFTIILSSLLLGIGICPLWLVLLTKASGEKRGQKISLVYLGWLIGIGTGFISMNYLVQLKIEHLLSLFPLLMVCAWIFFTIVNKSNVIIHQVNLKKQWDNTIKLLTRSKVVMPGILLQGIAMGMLIPILPSFAINELNLTYHQYSLFMLLGGGSAVILLFPIGKLVDVITNKSILFIAGFCLFAISLFMLAEKPNFVTTITIAVCLGIFYALFLPSWNAFVASYISNTLIEASWGIFSSLQGLGVMIGPTIGSLLAHQHNTVTTIQGSACIFGITALFYILNFLRKVRNA